MITVPNHFISDQLDCIPVTQTTDQQRIADTLRKLLRDQSTEQTSSTMIDSMISSKECSFE